MWSNQPPIQYNRNYFSGIKRPGREAYHSSPSSSEAVNEWSCTSASPICLRGVDGDYFTFFYRTVCKCTPYSSRYKHQLFGQTPLTVRWCMETEYVRQELTFYALFKWKSDFMKHKSRSLLTKRQHKYSSRDLPFAVV